MTKRTRWDDIKKTRSTKSGRVAGYERARRAFELSEQVRALRENLGMSQSELARRMGSTQPAVARLEAGGVAPSIETLERVAQALGVELVVRFDPMRSKKAS